MRSAWRGTSGLGRVGASDGRIEASLGRRDVEDDAVSHGGDHDGRDALVDEVRREREERSLGTLVEGALSRGLP